MQIGEQRSGQTVFLLAEAEAEVDSSREQWCGGVRGPQVVGASVVVCLCSSVVCLRVCWLYAESGAEERKEVAVREPPKSTREQQSVVKANCSQIGRN